jgi:hypothetical protein
LNSSRIHRRDAENTKDDPNMITSHDDQQASSTVHRISYNNRNCFPCVLCVSAV